jgi:hypothetical protein
VICQEHFQEDITQQNLIECEKLIGVDDQEMIILQYLAECQHHLCQRNFLDAYSLSKKVITLRDAWACFSDHCLLFISLFQHIVVCDQLEFTEECSNTLKELLQLSQEIDFPTYHDFYIDSLFYSSVSTFFDLATFAKTDTVRDTLLVIKERLLMDSDDLSVNSRYFSDLEDENVPSRDLEAKKGKKKNRAWWKKKFARWVERIKILKDAYDYLKEAWDIIRKL